MIVKVKELFRLAGLVMAGSEGDFIDLSEVRPFTVPGYGKVQTFGTLAFQLKPPITQQPDGHWVAYPFPAEILYGNVTLKCPHCDMEWPEECTCNGVNIRCACFACRQEPAYFEPARDKEAEGKREKERYADKMLPDLLGSQRAVDQLLRRVGGDSITAYAVVIWAKMGNPETIDMLRRAARMAADVAVIAKDVEKAGMPGLIDPLNGQPPKRRHRAEQLLEAAYTAACLMQAKSEHPEFEETHD